MSYNVLGSDLDNGFFVITDDDNLHRSIVTYQMAEPEDSLMPLEDAPAAYIIESIGKPNLIESFISVVGFYWHRDD